MSKIYNRDLLDVLDAQPMKTLPLTGKEFDRVLALAQRGVAAALPAGPAERKRSFTMKKQRWLSLAAAACVVLLGSINLASPALAESLPVVGGVFSWLNGHTGNTLASEQLDSYAAEVDLAATAANGAEETLTLRQIWRDEEWMRLSIELTDADGSLADYNAIAFYGDPMQDPHEAHGDLAVEIDGQTLWLMAEGGSLCLERMDDTTFAAELRYRMDADADRLIGCTARLTLSDLRGCVLETPAATETGATCTVSGEQTPLPGSYAVTFTFPAVSAEGRRTAADPGVQQMLSVPKLVATPAYTYLEVLAAHNSPFGGDHNSQETDIVGEIPLIVLTGPDGKVYREERMEGRLVDETDPDSDTLYFGYWDAIPEDVDTVTLAVYHSDGHLDPVGDPAATFTLTLR